MTPIQLLFLLVGAGGLGTAHYERQFIGYNIKRARDISIYRQLYPLAIPQRVPSINRIAKRLFKKVDPKDFYFGASTSEHQSSKQCTPELCSWSRYAQERNLTQPTEPRYKMDWWNYGENYLDDAQEAIPGFNAMRFSIEMALLTPSGPDSWDQSVADHYVRRFLYTLKKGMAPVVCFHHYTDPNWFLDAGGFEKEENIDQFVNPCIKLYEQMMRAASEDEDAMKELKKMLPRTPLWVTFNGPDAYAFRSYFAHAGPPDKKGFSFHKEKANDVYYGARISRGIKEPDIHGTVLFLWGISIIVQILGIEAEFGFQEFRA